MAGTIAALHGVAGAQDEGAEAPVLRAADRPYGSSRHQGSGESTHADESGPADRSVDRASRDEDGVLLLDETRVEGEPDRPEAELLLTRTPVMIGPIPSYSVLERRIQAEDALFEARRRRAADAAPSEGSGEDLGDERTAGERSPHVSSPADD